MMLNETLRLIRVLHDMSAKDLAKELEISVAQLSKIENGVASPSIELLEKYAKVFKTTSASLLLFAQDLDKEKKRGKVKTSIRNTMFKLLKILEGLSDGQADNKNSTEK